MLAVALATLLKFFLASLIQEESPFLLFFFAILFSAWVGGRGPGLLATGLAALSADYFFLVPYYSFVVNTAGQTVRIGVFLVEGTLISLVIFTLRTVQQRAEDSVSEIQRNEESLRESEERFLRLAEEAVEGLVLSENGVVFNANLSFTRMFGYEPGEVVGMNASDFLSSEYREKTTRRVLSGNSEPYESRGLRKDGTVFPIGVRPRQIPFHGREVRVTSVLDLTERKRVEETLRFFSEASTALSSSLDYRATLAKLARLAVPYLADWCAVDMVEDDGSTRRLAVAHEDPEKVALVHELQERYPPDPDAGFGVPRVLRTGEPELVPEIPDLLLEEAAADGEHREMLRALGLKSYLVVPLVARGRRIGTITLAAAESGRRYGPADLKTAEDLARRAALAVDNARLYEEAQEGIAGRERVEDTLRESEERYRAVVEQAAEGIYLIDADTKHIVEANPESQRLLGYDPEEVLRLTLYDIVAHDQESIDRNIQLTLREGSRSVGERQYRRKDGSLLEVVSAGSAISYRGRRVISIVIHDVTERKRAEVELRRQRDLYEGLLTAQSEVGEGFVIAEGSRISFANEAFSRISGYSSEELTSMPSLFGLFLDEERDALRERFTSGTKGCEMQDHREIAIRSKDGRKVELR